MSKDVHVMRSISRRLNGLNMERIEQLADELIAIGERLDKLGLRPQKQSLWQANTDLQKVNDSSVHNDNGDSISSFHVDNALTPPSSPNESMTSVFRMAGQTVGNMQQIDALVQLMRLVAAIGQNLVVYQCAPSSVLIDLIFVICTAVSQNQTDALCEQIPSIQQQLLAEASLILENPFFSINSAAKSVNVKTSIRRRSRLPTMNEHDSSPSNDECCTYPSPSANNQDRCDTPLTLAVHIESVLTLSDLLKPVHVGLHLAMYVNRRTPSTLAHVYNAYNNWCSFTVFSPILWIKGAAGSGKSVALAYLFDNMFKHCQYPPVISPFQAGMASPTKYTRRPTQSEASDTILTDPIEYLVAYFSCSFDPSRRRLASTLLCTVAFQLATQNSKFLHGISLTDSLDTNLQDLMDRLLVRPMRQLNPHTTKVFVFIDDIDMLDDSDELMQYIQAISKNPAQSYIHFVITTKMYAEKRWLDISLTSILDLGIKEYLEIRDHDVATYVSSELIAIQPLTKLNAEDAGELAALVNRQANTSFRSAVLIMMNIRLAAITCNLKKTGDNRLYLHKSVTAGNVHLFDEYLLEISQILNVVIVKSLLQIIPYTIRVVNTDLVAELMMYGFGCALQPAIIEHHFGWISAAINFSQNGQHAETLCRLIESPDSKFHVVSEEAHYILVVACLRRLSQNRLEMDMHRPDTLFAYASMHWHEHMARSHPDSEIATFVFGFLTSPGLMYYLETLSSMDMLLTAKSAFRTIMLKLADRIATYTRDIDFIVSNFADMLVTTPAEIFRSVLVFTPPANVIRRALGTSYLAPHHGVLTDGLLSHVGTISAMVLAMDTKNEWGTAARLNTIGSAEGDLYTGSIDGQIMSWDVLTMKHVRTFTSSKFIFGTKDKKPKLDVLAIAVQRKLSLMVTGHADFLARLWDTLTGKLIHILQGHKGAVTGVVFGADGNEVITGSQDKTARIWDVKSGEQLQIIDRSMPAEAQMDNKEFMLQFDTIGTMRMRLNADTITTIQHGVNVHVRRTDGAVFVSQSVDAYSSAISKSTDIAVNETMPVVYLPLSLRDLALAVALPSVIPGQLCLWLFTKLGFLTIVGLPDTGGAIACMYKSMQAVGPKVSSMVGARPSFEFMESETDHSLEGTKKVQYSSSSYEAVTDLAAISNTAHIKSEKQAEMFYSLLTPQSFPQKAAPISSNLAPVTTERVIDQIASDTRSIQPMSISKPAESRFKIVDAVSSVLTSKKASEHKLFAEPLKINATDVMPKSTIPTQAIASVDASISDQMIQTKLATTVVSKTSKQPQAAIVKSPKRQSYSMAKPNAQQISMPNRTYSQQLPPKPMYYDPKSLPFYGPQPTVPKQPLSYHTSTLARSATHSHFVEPAKAYRPPFAVHRPILSDNSTQVMHLLPSQPPHAYQNMPQPHHQPFPYIQQHPMSRPPQPYMHTRPLPVRASRPTSQLEFTSAEDPMRLYPAHHLNQRASLPAHAFSLQHHYNNNQVYFQQQNTNQFTEQTHQPPFHSIRPQMQYQSKSGTIEPDVSLSTPVPLAMQADTSITHDMPVLPIATPTSIQSDCPSIEKFKDTQPVDKVEKIKHSWQGKIEQSRPLPIRQVDEISGTLMADRKTKRHDANLDNTEDSFDGDGMDKDEGESFKQSSSKKGVLDRYSQQGILSSFLGKLSIVPKASK
ncbi:hypothetical protein BDV3_005330 [Batrachochytrium dendrobatidis]